MAAQQSPEDQLLDLLYAASTDQSGWLEFLKLLASSQGATCAAFLFQHELGPSYSIAETFNVPNEVTVSYNEYYGQFDPWRIGMQERRLIDWAGLGEELCPPAKFDQSELYNDSWRTMGFKVRSQAGIICGSRGTPWVLSLLRARGQPEFDEKHANALRWLFPHLRRALAVYQRVTAMKQSAADAGGIVDSLDVGLISLDSHRRICFTNSIAGGYLREGEVLTTRDGRLCESAPDSGELELLLTAAIGGRMSRGGEWAVTLNKSSRSLHLTVLPAKALRGMIPVQPRIVLAVVDTAAVPGDRAKVLSALFQLTPAEVRVAMLLVAGFDSGQIAEQMRTTPDAVWFRLKIVFQKTGVRKQGQLVRLLSMLPGVV